MSVVYIMLPVALLLAAGAVVAFILAARSGQFDDVDTPAFRMLPDDDTSPCERRPREGRGDRAAPQ